MKKKSLLLVLTAAIPLNMAMASEYIELECRFRDKEILSHEWSRCKIVLEKSKFEKLDFGPNIIKEDIVVRAKNINAETHNNDLDSIIVTNSEQDLSLFLDLIENLAIEKNEATRGVEAAVVFGNSLNISDESLLQDLVNNITILPANSMRNNKAAVVFGNN